MSSCSICHKEFSNKELDDDIIELYCYPCYIKKHPERELKSTYPLYEKEHSISKKNLEVWK